MFICTINPDEPLQLDILNDGHETLINAAVGYCAETGCTYSLNVSLTPLPATLTPELRFFIVEAQPDASHMQAWFDGALSLPVISNPNYRGLIRAVLCSAVRCLIQNDAPEAVEMMTRTANLPERALSKFYQIAGIFSESGYDARRADAYGGRYIWMMRKQCAGTLA